MIFSRPCSDLQKMGLQSSAASQSVVTKQPTAIQRKRQPGDEDPSIWFPPSSKPGWPLRFRR